MGKEPPEASWRQGVGRGAVEGVKGQGREELPTVAGAGGGEGGMG